MPSSKRSNGTDVKWKRNGSAGHYISTCGKYELWQEVYAPRNWYVNQIIDGEACDALFGEGHPTKWEATSDLNKWLDNEAKNPPKKIVAEPVKSRAICEVCGTYEGTPHREDCPLSDDDEIPIDGENDCCGECLADDVELTDGLCDDCLKEDCEACDGTGMSGEWDEKEGSQDCNECGGDGRI